MQVIKFKYYDEFHCIGAECSDSCCKNWRITLSKREYLDYKKLKCSEELRRIIDNAFVRNKKSDNDFEYAQMKLRENGDCPFLGDDSLCMLQKEMGEGVLDYVCSTYPRLWANVGGDNHILTCTTTCPYVNELLINHPEGLEIIEEEYDGKSNIFIQRKVSNISTPNTWEGYPYYWTIKTAQVDTLQNRNFTISERMLVLGFFCQKAEEYIKNKQGEKIQGLADMLLDNDTFKKIAESLKTDQTEEDRALKTLSEFSKAAQFVLNAMHTNSAIKSHYSKVKDSVDLNLELKEGKLVFTSNPEKYAKSVEIYKKLESERPYIIENLLVNTVFTQAPNNGIWLNFFIVAVFYSMLKICVPAFLPENYTDRDLALALTYTSKMILNSHIADKGAAVDFMDHNSFDLPHAAFLIS